MLSAQHSVLLLNSIRNVVWRFSYEDVILDPLNTPTLADNWRGGKSRFDWRGSRLTWRPSDQTTEVTSAWTSASRNLPLFSVLSSPLLRGFLFLFTLTPTVRGECSAISTVSSSICTLSTTWDKCARLSPPVFCLSSFYPSSSSVRRCPVFLIVENCSFEF